MNIIGGQEYALSITYLWGKIDSEGTLYGWILCARFYRANGIVTAPPIKKGDCTRFVHPPLIGYPLSVSGGCGR